jgi:hypothetical protein
LVDTATREPSWIFYIQGPEAFTSAALQSTNITATSGGYPNSFAWVFGGTIPPKINVTRVVA